MLIQYGTEAQKRHWLPRILDGSDWSCQGYSEPGAGSDLASLKTTAVRNSDRHVVNGQKAWTTLAQYANRMFALVRTDRNAKPQEGISFLLIDLDSPGVEVRPIGWRARGQRSVPDRRARAAGAAGRCGKTRAGRSLVIC